MRLAGFEPSIPTSKRPQTRALDHAATEFIYTQYVFARNTKVNRFITSIPRFSRLFMQKKKLKERVPMEPYVKIKHMLIQQRLDFIQITYKNSIHTSQKTKSVVAA